MHDLGLEDKLNTSEAGFPEVFVGLFPEVQEMLLEYSIERVNLADVPRRASSWWPVEPGTSYFMVYPTQFHKAPFTWQSTSTAVTSTKVSMPRLYEKCVALRRQKVRKRH